MKQKCKNILVLFLALIIFSVGNGVNLIEYCCNHCENQGVEIFISDSCEGLHQQYHHNISHDVCCSSNSHEKEETDSNSILNDKHKCQFTRFNIELANDLPVKVGLQLTALAVINYSQIIPAYKNTLISKNNFPSIGYVHDSGRTLLSHICILTI